MIKLKLVLYIYFIINGIIGFDVVGQNKKQIDKHLKFINDSIDRVEDSIVKMEIRNRINILNTLIYNTKTFEYFPIDSCNGDTVVERIKYITKNYYNIKDWETLTYLRDELGGYVFTIKSVNTFKYLLKEKIPIITTEELLANDNGNMHAMDDTSAADLYFAFMAFTNYARGVPEYCSFLNIIKKDHFLNFLHNNYPVVEDENMTKENILLFAKDFQKLDEDDLNRLFEFSETTYGNFESFLYEIDSKQEFFRRRIQAGFKDQELFDSIATFDSTFFCNDELWKVKDMIKKKFSAKRNHYGGTWDAEPLERILKKYCVCREE